LQRLNRAFDAFFRRIKDKTEKAGFPRFRGKDRYDSFTLKQAGYKIEGRYLYITGIGKFKLYLSRPIEGDIKTVTIRHTSSGKWFVCFSCDNVPLKDISEAIAEVGIDVGIKAFLVDSTGRSVENPKFFRQSERILRRRQRALARKIRGSRRRVKAKILVAKAHEKIVNQRKDFLHKVANFYIGAYRTIYVEALNIKGMVKNRHLSKSIADASWNKFFEFLSYKAVGAGRVVIKVNPRNTSQNCSQCGEKVKKSLSVRTHACPFCGLILDRDHNAAIVIKSRGQRNQMLSIT
jgi:putative transposase